MRANHFFNSGSQAILIFSYTPVFFGELMNSKERKHEARFQSNMDYYATYKKSFGHQRVKSIDQTLKGHICIRFNGLDEVSTLISPYGTIQVFYFTLDELNTCLKFLGEILVPRFNERLHLTPKGTFSLVDKIRCLIQEDKITHDMSIDSEAFAELTGWEKEDIKNAMPTIMQEIFPYGIELKVSRIIAGCSRPEPYVEEWLKSVERALKTEGFYSPDSFEWEQNQSFELVKHMYAGANYDAITRVKAFLDGRVTVEAKPRHLAGLAHRTFNDTLDKYAIPYERETPAKTARNPLTLVTIMGIAVGTLALFVLLGSSEQN